MAVSISPELLLAQGREEKGRRTKQLYRNDPSKIVWIRKSNACQMNKIRYARGVSLDRTRLERIYAAFKIISTAVRETMVVWSSCSLMELMKSAILVGLLWIEQVKTVWEGAALGQVMRFVDAGK